MKEVTKDTVSAHKKLRVALNNLASGNSTEYDQFIKDLRSIRTQSDANTSQRIYWLNGLLKMVSMLDKQHAQIVKLVVAMDVSAQSDETFYRIYLEFLETVVSAHSVHAQSVLRKLMNLLRKQPIQEELDAALLEADEKFRTRIHVALRNIMRTVPASTTIICKFIEERFPQKLESLLAHDKFTAHLMRMCQYAPLARQTIMETIISRMILMDVDITIDIDDLEDEERLLMDSIKFKPGQDASDNEQDSDDDEEEIEDRNSDKPDTIVPPLSDSEDDTFETEADEQLKRSKEMLAKVDIMNSHMIDYLNRLNTSSKPGAPDRTLLSLYHSLLTIFDKMVLRTHKSKYTQVIIFYASSMHSSFSETFLSLLLMRMFDEKAAKYLRCTASAYYASYLARAKHIDAQTLCHCMKLCVDWVHTYLDRLESSHATLAMDTSKHATFYSAVQSVLYIFCFRWRDLSEMVDQSAINVQLPPTPHKRRRLNSLTHGTHGVVSGSGSDIIEHEESLLLADKLLTNNGLKAPGMHWWRMRGGFQRVLFSKLQPLQVCAKTVVSEFDSIAHKLEIVYCAPMMMKNDSCSTPPPSPVLSENRKRASAICEEELMESVEVGQVLESFFPFDPFYCHLSSKSFIDPLYVEWQGGNDDDDEPLDSDSDVDNLNDLNVNLDSELHEDVASDLGDLSEVSDVSSIASDCPQMRALDSVA